MIRIIAGKYKNRLVPTLKSATYRPSSSRFKEAMFSILQSGEFDYDFITRCNVLDLFSGTGNLAFEALSRGAKSATLVEINSEYLALAKDFATQLDKDININFINKDALNLPTATQSFDLVFIDPPYNKNIISKTINNLIAKEWIQAGSILVVETAKIEDPYILDNMQLLIQRIYGNSKLIITKILKS